MGKRTGAVIVSALFDIFLVAVFGIPTSVESVYPTPTPTPPVGSCTGIADCNVNPGGCGGSCDACESYSTTTCYSASGVPTVCNQGCSNNTACVRPDGSYCSTPPAGCPSDRSVPECSWSGANDCGGGVCGCGERRSGTLWCDGQHCDDICTSDQACIAGCNGPTPTPGVPTPTPPSCQEYCSPSCACDCYSLSCSGGVCNPEPYCSPSCTCGCSSPSCSGGVCNPEPYCSPSCACDCSSLSCSGGVCNPGPPCAPYCSPSCICDCSSLSLSGGVCNPPPYCSPSCTCGCSSLSCSGGVCNPPPCTPYCSPSCTCGCSSLSLSGGVCNPPPCTPYCSPSCTCGCSSISLSGGVCKPEPYCSPSCTCGCSSLSCNGGVCNPGPPCAPGIIQARAMVVTKPNTSCDDVKNSTTTLTGTVTHQFTLSSASQPTQVQSGNSYTVFNNVIPGSYTIDSQVPAQYVLARACWTSVLDTPSSGESKSHELTPADTLTWDLGYTSGVAWSQAQGGDVYASATLRSYVPSLTSPRAFILNGVGGYPGVATYGGNCNFDSSSATCGGKTWVSSKNWLVHDTASGIDYYQLLYRQFGGTPTTVDYINPTSPIAKPPSRATPYYVTGNMST